MARWPRTFLSLPYLLLSSHFQSQITLVKAQIVPLAGFPLDCLLGGSTLPRPTSDRARKCPRQEHSLLDLLAHNWSLPYDKRHHLVPIFQPCVSSLPPVSWLSDSRSD